MMDLSTLIKNQIAADTKRGFPVIFHTDQEKYSQLIKDLVGLYGEIGEFSNLVKKVGLKLDRSKYNGPSFADVERQLREELADTMIYLMRVSAILGVDLEREIITKMNINSLRYQSLESD